MQKFAHLDRIDLSQDGQYGGARFSNVGNGNTIYVPRTGKLQPFQVDLTNKSGNTLVFDERCNLRHDSRITIEGRGHALTVMGGGGTSRVNFTMRGNDGTLYYGQDCTANEIDCLVHGDVSLTIGRSCLFSFGITIRTFDSHAIVDVEERRQINSAKSVEIGERSWIAQDVIIMPGVTIGNGSIIGAGAIVTRSVPPASLSVGIPARIIREGVTWTREASPTQAQIDAAIDALKRV